MCIDIVEIWFGLANGQISSTFDSYLPTTRPYVLVYILMGKFRQLLTEICARHMLVAGDYRFFFFFFFFLNFFIFTTSCFFLCNVIYIF